MAKSTITREESVQAVFDLKVGYRLGFADIEILKRVARMALAAMDSEPVAEVLSIRPGNDTSTIDRALPVGTQLYRHAQPAPDRDQVRREHAEFSQTTFGNVGPVGPLKHLSKEALEAAAEPDDLSEWADMQFLLWDAQRRAGITDEQITLAMIEKLAVNKLREWPAPKDGEPRLHIKEQPAPVAEREPIAWLNDAYLARGVVDGEAGSEDAGPGYIPVYREASPAQPAPVVMDDIKLRELFDSWFASDCSFDRSPEASEEGNIAWRESYWYVWQRCRAAMLQAGTLTNEGETILHNYRTAMEGIGHIRRTLEETFGGLHGTHVEPDVLMDCKTICDAIYAAYSGNSPVIPEGYVMVPKEPTNEMLAAAKEWTGLTSTAEAVYIKMLEAATQPQNEPQNIPEIIPQWIPVSERMPEDRISVILWDAEIGEVTSGHYSHKTQTFYHCGDAIENEITHWMPPPCAPAVKAAVSVAKTETEGTEE